MAKALADRLAEAFAEWVHERARREWYAPSEHLPNEELIGERYRGIRPAFGYPACPDHSEKARLLELLDAESAGMVLTESCATLPAASVSGLLLGHPQARYFSIGRIARDQVEDYAARKGVSHGRGGALAPPQPGLRAPGIEPVTAYSAPCGTRSAPVRSRRRPRGHAPLGELRMSGQASSVEPCLSARPAV